MSIKLTGQDALLAKFQRLVQNADGAKPWMVGTGVEYAPFVEFGTSRARAQPYLRPAADEARGKMATFRGEFGDEGNVQAVIKAVALYIEGRAKAVVPVDTGNLRNSIRSEEA